jgi:hypothetical protein
LKKSDEKEVVKIPLDAFTFLTSVEVNKFRTTEAYSKGDPSEIKIKYQEDDKKKRKTL